MTDSLKKIFRNILIITAIFISLSAIIKLATNKETGLGIDTRIIEATFQGNSIVFKDAVTFNMNTPLLFYYRFNDFYSDDVINCSNIEVSHNGIKDYYYTTTPSVIITNDMLRTLKVSGNANLSTNVTYRVKRSVLTNDYDYTLLSYKISLDGIDYLNKLIMIINVDESIADIQTDNADIMKKDGKYFITLENLKNTTSLDIKIYPSNSVILEPLPHVYGEASYNQRYIVLLSLFFASCVILIIGLIINKKPKVTEYKKDATGLESALIAEFLIDKKVNIKTLIMTTIIELSIKGNVEIINNNTVRLLSLDGTNYIEKKILSFLFANHTTEVEFSYINSLFAKSNKRTSMFSNVINDIRYNITTILITTKMFNVPLSFLSSALKSSAYIICLALPLLFINLSYITEVILAAVFLLVIYLLRIPTLKDTDLLRLKSYSSFRKYIFAVLTIMLIIIMMVLIRIENLSHVLYKPEFFIILICTVIINLITINKCKSVVLSANGNSKLIELLKFKKYIDEHSLIKERDLKSVVLWDEYLAYATAFGIPSKVINSIYEDWYNLNMSLQIIANPLGF